MRSGLVNCLHKLPVLMGNVWLGVCWSIWKDIHEMLQLYCGNQASVPLISKFPGPWGLSPSKDALNCHLQDNTAASSYNASCVQFCFKVSWVCSSDFSYAQQHWGSWWESFDVVTQLVSQVWPKFGKWLPMFAISLFHGLCSQIHTALEGILVGYDINYYLLFPVVRKYSSKSTVKGLSLLIPGNYCLLCRVIFHYTLPEKC